MSRDDPYFRLRIPSDLKDRVAAAAKQNNRSINAEIVNALGLHYPEPPPLHLLVQNIEALSAMVRDSKNADRITVLWGLLDELGEHFRREEPEMAHNVLVKMGRRRDDDSRGPRAAPKKSFVQRPTGRKPKI